MVILYFVSSFLFSVVIAYLVKTAYVFICLWLCRHYLSAFSLSLFDGGLRVHMTDHLLHCFPIGWRNR